jgi:hypothetical protein
MQDIQILFSSLFPLTLALNLFFQNNFQTPIHLPKLLN